MRRLSYTAQTGVGALPQRHAGPVQRLWGNQGGGHGLQRLHLEGVPRGIGQTLYEQHRVGVGDLAAFQQAQVDLVGGADAGGNVYGMGGFIGQGNIYIGISDLVAALGSYKAAGSYGASALGPEIDAAGAPQATQPLTQQAWQLNGSLQALNATDQATVMQAGALANQMFGLYQQAIAAGIAASGGTPPPPVPPPKPPAPKPPPSPNPPPAPAPGTPSTSSNTPLYIGAGVVAAALVGWALYARKR